MITLVFCCNDRIFEGVFLSAVSAARRTAMPLEVRLLTMDRRADNAAYVPLSEVHAQELARALHQLNPANRVIRQDLTCIFERVFGGGKNLKNSYTPYALLRLLLDREDVCTCDRVIYLDADTMVCADLLALWETDISEYEYAAAPDFLGTFWVAQDYCNSGVLYLNLEKIRQTGMFEKCRKLIFTKWYAMPDQSAIHNAASARLVLPRRFNEQRAVTSDTVIKHFNKGIVWFPFPHFYNIKQWERDAVQRKLRIHTFDDDYAFYDQFYHNDKKVTNETT